MRNFLIVASVDRIMCMCTGDIRRSSSKIIKRVVKNPHKGIFWSVIGGDNRYFH